MAASPIVKAANICAQLGWDYYDGCNAIDRADDETLRALLEILKTPDAPGTPEWVTRRARAAARYIEETVLPSRHR